jgi:hypothetical protein
MALLQNQFAMTTLVGTKVSGTNVMPVEAYDADPATTFVPGEMVTIKATNSGTVTKVIKGSAATDLYVGVILTNPVKDSWVSGEKFEIAMQTTMVYMTASAAITAGAKLQYDYATGKVATQTANNTVIGMAVEDAAADASILRVLVQPNWLNNAGETNTASNAGTAGEGLGLVLAKVVADLPFKRLKAGTAIVLTAETNDILIDTTAEANTMSAAGTAGEGYSLVLAKDGVDLPVKRLLGGTGVTLTETTNGIVISLT